MLDLVVRRARLATGVVDIGIGSGRIAAIAPHLPPGPPSRDAESLLVVPGLIETHLHLDKACIIDRCRIERGGVEEAIEQTARAKSRFTTEDIHARGASLLERCVAQGTTRIRTHVELDPGIALRGLDAVEQLARDFRWALDLTLCVFPQEGLLNRPGTEALLREGLRRGAGAIGAVPYADTDPRGHIDAVFALAREFDVDIDMHLDLGDGADGMQADYVCRKTDEHRLAGRVAVGHLTRMSYLPAPQADALAARLAGAGVAVTILPATDLFLTGRQAGHATPRGVVDAARLRRHGVTCSVATNNVLNPFTPYGDASLIRMANLYANVAHVGRPEDLAACLDMVTTDAARLLRLPDYGIAVGHPADLVVLDAADPASAVATLAQPLWGLKNGRLSFERPRPRLHPPGLP